MRRNIIPFRVPDTILPELATARGPYSPTRLQVFETCPHRYHLEYAERVTRVPDEDTQRAMHMGSLVHEFVQGYALTLIEHGLAQDLELADREARLVFAGREPGLLQEADHDEFMDMCLRFARTHEMPTDGELLVEHEVALDRLHRPVAWDSPEAVFRCRPDLVHVAGHEVSVIDWKTGRGVAGPDRTQLELYAYAVSRLRPEVQQFKLIFDHVRLGFTEVFLLGRLEVDRVGEKLDRLRARLETEENFAPTPRAACATCPVSYACRARPSGLDHATTEAEARKLAEDVALLESRMAIKKRVLRNWCLENGPVPVAGGEFDVRAREVVKLDLTARGADGRSTVFDQALRAAGLDPELFKKPDGRQARSLLDTPVVGPLLRPIATTRIERRFSLKRIGDNEQQEEDEGLDGLA